MATLLDKSTEASVRAAILGTARAADTAAFTETRGIHCNEGGGYKLTFVNNPAAVTMQLTSGVFYPYALTNIIDSDDSAPTVTAITLIY